MTAGKSPKWELRWAKITAALAALLLLVGVVTSGALADGGSGTDTPTAPLAPSISSDQADYPPGSTVTLTGAGWQPTESVHVVVNDTLGQTWQYTADVIADLAGGFTLQFDLPNTFISNYDVTATGTWNDEATTSFTDGNVTSISGTVTDSVTHNPLSGVAVTCNTSTGCNNTFTTTTDASGNYSFSGSNKLAFATNGPVTLTLQFSKSGYTTGTITLSNVNNGNSFTNENIALVPSVQNQTITFAQPTTPQSFGATFNVDPTASSGLPVTVTAHAGSVCSVATATTGFDVTMTAGSGSCVLDANQAGNSGFSAAPQVSRTVTAQKATSTTTITCPASATYTGSALMPCTALVTGVGLSQSVSVSYGANTGVGTAHADASYGGDADHSSSSDSKTFAITKASSSTVVTCPAGPYTYTGNVQEPCSASVTGAGSLDQSVTVTYTDNTNAGTAHAAATFDGDANHESSSDATTFTIGQAQATVAITWADGTYTGSPQPATATVSGVGTPAEDLGAASSLTYYAGSDTTGTVLGGAPVDAGTYTVEADFNGNTNYPFASATQTITIDKADSTTDVTCAVGPFVFEGTAQTPCTVLVTGAGGLQLTPDADYSNNTNAGTATASYHYAGDPNHKPSDDSEDFTIKAAPSTTTVTCDAGPFVYDATPQTPCHVSVTGAGGLDLTPSADYSDNTDAGSATASYHYAGDANHDPSSDSTHFTIDPAPSVTTVTCDLGPFVYDGSPQEPCTAAVTGVGGLDQELTVTYSDNTDAGIAHASASFAGDANHDPSDDSKTFAIKPAPSTTTVTCDPGPFVYDATPQTPCHVTVTGAGGLSLAPDPEYSNNTGAGTATASYDYAGDANHDPSGGSKDFTIDRAASFTTVTCDPGPFVYDATPQTPCHVTVTGIGGLSLAPDPDYSNNTDAGLATASYHFAGDANHKPSDDSEGFTIDPATPTVSVDWSGWTFDGTAHAAAGSVSGVGSPAASLGNPSSFSYYAGTTASGAPLSGAPTTAGDYTVVAHYGGSANYTSADSDPKTVTVAKATPTITITWATPQTFTGDTHPATTAVTGVGTPPAALGDADTLTYYSGSTASGTPLADAPTDAGTYTVEAEFDATTNYSHASEIKTITIDKASSATTVTCPASVSYTATAQTPCNAGVAGAGGLSQTVPITYSSNTAVGTAGASATYGGDPNHDGSADTETFKIVYGTAEVLFLQPINGTAHNLSTNPDVSTFKAGSTIPVKVQVKLSNGMIVHPATASWLPPQKLGPTSQPVDETIYSDPATTGAAFAWDSTGQFLQYNWGTPKTGGGFYYLIAVKLDDGQTYTVYISLR